MFKRMRAVALSCLLVISATILAACSSSEEYVPELPEATLSKPAIANDGVLRVGVNTDKSPLAGLGNDKIIGIDVDIAAELADTFGLKLEVQDVGADAAKAIEDDKVDLVLGVDSSEKPTEVWTSDSYIPTGVALFALTSRNAPVPTTTSQPEIAAQVSSKSAWAVTNTFGDDSLVSTVDLATAFNDLGAGSIEYVASDAIIGMYAANRQGVDVSIIALLEPASGYCAATALENTELQDALKTALGTIDTNGVLSVIEKKWLGKAIDFSNIEVIEGHKISTGASEDVGEGTEEGEGGEGTDNAAATEAQNAVAASAANAAQAANAAANNRSNSTSTNTSTNTQS